MVRFSTSYIGSSAIARMHRSKSYRARNVTYSSDGGGGFCSFSSSTHRIAGAATLMFLTAANSTVQLAAADAIRGRVMGVYLLVFIGSGAVGGPLLGYIDQRLGLEPACSSPRQPSFSPWSVNASRARPACAFVGDLMRPTGLGSCHGKAA